MRGFFLTGTSSSSFRSIPDRESHARRKPPRRLLQRSQVLLDVRTEVLLDEHHANGGRRRRARPGGAQTEVRGAAGQSAKRLVFQRMPEITSNDSLREEFNRWAEAGRGEGMEQDHLPITLPVLERMRLA